MYINEQINKQKISTSKKETITCNRPIHCMTNEYLYSPNKYGRRINSKNTIKTTQLQIRQKHLKLDSNLDTRLAHNTLGRAKPKYS